MVKLSVNRIAILTSGIILAGILLLLSVLYFQGKPTSSGSQDLVTAPKKAQSTVVPPRRRLTDAEREELRLEREAERTGQTAQEMRDVPEQPLEQIEREAEHAAEAAPETAMSNLTRKKRQLEKIAPENVEEAVDFLDEQALERPTRETTVKQEVSIDQFDANSAQIDDCERFQNPDGSWRYVATLVDAKGNSVKVDMTETEGAATYRTMKMVKSSPLLESIYRGSVMGMLDQKLENEKKMPTSAPESLENAETSDEVTETEEK